MVGVKARSLMAASWTPQKPPMTLGVVATDVIESYRCSPHLLLEQIERSYAEMKKSLKESRKLLRKLKAEYHQVADPIYIDENEVKMISIKIIKEQIEQLKKRIKCRTRTRVMKVTITTTSKELQTQLDIFNDFSSIRLNATVDFTSLDDVHKALQEIRQAEADKKECKQKLELIANLEKELIKDVHSTTVTVKPGGEAYFQIQNKRDELEQLIKIEKDKISYYEGYDVEKEKKLMDVLSKQR